MFWKGLSGYLPANIAQGLVGVLSIVVFTRLLSPSQYGAYALGFSVMALTQSALFTWSEAAMARFYAAEGQGESGPHHFRTLYLAWTGVALTFPLLIAAVMVFAPLPGAARLAIVAGLCMVPLRSLTKLVQERRRAAGDVRAAAGLDLAQTIGGFAIGAGLIALHLGGAAPLLGAGLMCGLCLVFALPAELRAGRGGRFEPPRLKLYAGYGAPVALSLILSLVLASTDRFVLAGLTGEAAVGAYHAGYSLANRTLDVMFIWMGAASGPALVMALERGGKAALAIAAREQAGIMLLLAVPAAVGVALTAGPLAQVMVGEALRVEAAKVTPFVAAAALFGGFNTYYLAQAFTLGKRTWRLMLAMAIPAAVNLVLNLVLVPRFGAQGAAAATALSFALGALCSYLLGRSALVLPMPWLTLGQALAASVAMAAVVLLLPSPGGVLELGLKAGLGALAYGVVVLALDAGGLRSRLAPRLAPLRARLAPSTTAIREKLVDNAARKSAKPALSVLIPFFRDDPCFLISALDREDVAAELAPLDDGGGDQALTQRVVGAVRAARLPARLIVLSANQGRARGRNRLARHARADSLLFLDSDMLPDHIDFLARWLSTRADVAFGGFTLDQTPRTRRHALHRHMALRTDCLDASTRALQPEKHVFTSNLLVSRRVFDAIGFDEAFTGWGWEDVEWAMRVARSHPILHLDNSASHLGLDEAAILARKYEQSAGNFSRVVASHPALVRTYPSYRIARLFKRAPMRRAWRPVLKFLALADALPLAARDLCMRLYRAALYAEAV